MIYVVLALVVVIALFTFWIVAHYWSIVGQVRSLAHTNSVMHARMQADLSALRQTRRQVQVQARLDTENRVGVWDRIENGLTTDTKWIMSEQAAEAQLAQMDVQVHDLSQAIRGLVALQAQLSPPKFSTYLNSLVPHHKTNLAVQDGLSPPKLAEYILYFLPQTQRDALIGDLEELYHVILARHGRRKARFWYRSQVVIAFCKLLRSPLSRLLKVGVVIRLLSHLLPSWDWVRKLIP